MIEMNLKKATETQTATLKVDTKIEQYDKYQGEYNVTPSWVSQTLQTKNKVMTGNVTVNPIEITGSETFTENGTFDVTQIAEAIVNVKQGALNYVEGTFTPQVRGSNEINIPYEGNGYPICAIIFVKGGAYDPSNTAWYDATNKFTFAQWAMSKSIVNVAPDYITARNAINQAVVNVIYKNSASSGTVYTTVSAMTAEPFGRGSAGGSWGSAVKFNSANTMLIYGTGGGTSTQSGFLVDIEYEYHIVYSE